MNFSSHCKNCSFTVTLNPVNALVQQFVVVMEGIVYQIVDQESDIRYVGSTTESLTQALSGHESSYKIWKNSNGDDFCSSYKILVDKKYIIEEIETVAVPHLLDTEYYHQFRLSCVEKCVNEITPSVYEGFAATYERKFGFDVMAVDLSASTAPEPTEAAPVSTAISKMKEVARYENCE